MSLCYTRADENQTVLLRRDLLVLVVILLAYVCIAWQSIQAPLVIGDDTAELAYIRSKPLFSQLAQYDCFFFFRPFKNLLFISFDALLPFGLAACRILAIAIGIASAMPVYNLFRRLLQNPAAVLSATACWLLAPTLVSCTSWLSCVNIQAMTGFAAGAMLLALRASELCGKLRFLCLACAWLTTGLALLCYEGAVCLPALVFAVHFYLEPARLRERRAWYTYLTIGSVVVLYLLLRALRTNVPHQLVNFNFGEMSNLQVVAAAPWFLFQHFSIWFWPFGQQAILGSYRLEQVSTALLVVLWLGLITGALACIWLRPRMLGLGLAWSLLAFLPMSNLFAFRNGPYGDYYLALASMGLCLCMGWIVHALIERSRHDRSAYLALLLIACWRLAATGESVVWSQAWNNGETILCNTLQTFPQAFSVMNEYARLCLRKEDYDACQVWTDRSVLLAPHNRDVHELRALVADHHGDLPLARQELDLFMQYGGTHESWGWYFQGYLLDERMGDTNAAARCYQQAIDHRITWSADVLDAQSALAFFALQRGDLKTAIADWEQIVQIDPARTCLRQNLVRAYRALGENKKAQQQLDFLQQPL